jgi:hypothetical protein
MTTHYKTKKHRISVKTAAHIIGISERYVRLLCEDGRLSSFKAGKQRGVWIYPDSLVSFLGERSSDGDSHINYLINCGILEPN